jgi:hypothetical protein
MCNPRPDPSPARSLLSRQRGAAPTHPGRQASNVAAKAGGRGVTTSPSLRRCGAAHVNGPSGVMRRAGALGCARTDWPGGVGLSVCRRLPSRAASRCYVWGWRDGTRLGTCRGGVKWFLGPAATGGGPARAAGWCLSVADGLGLLSWVLCVGIQGQLASTGASAGGGMPCGAPRQLGCVCASSGRGVEPMAPKVEPWQEQVSDVRGQPRGPGGVERSEACGAAAGTSAAAR